MNRNPVIEDWRWRHDLRVKDIEFLNDRIDYLVFYMKKQARLLQRSEESLKYFTQVERCSEKEERLLRVIKKHNEKHKYKIF